MTVVRTVLAWFTLALLVAGSAHAAEPAPARWYRGAVHAHANYGAPQLPTTAPDTVVRWYREHGFHFVAVTDLEHLTPTDGLKALFRALRCSWR